MAWRAAFVLGAGSLFQVGGEALAPCCEACGPGTEKYYSVPNPAEANPECGECCLQPSRYSFWKLFEPKLLPGDCTSQGFTEYNGTDTDGVWPLSVTSDRYVRAVACPDKLQAIYADMHDGDKKQVIVSGTSMTIKPSGSAQTWVVNAEIDPESCTAAVDFNVPGKPSPPPVKLAVTLWHSMSTDLKKTEFEFTDPSGTLAARGFPLNRWVDVSDVTHRTPAMACPTSLRAVYADMHDGDRKEVTISGKSITVRPSGNNQSWVVKSELDATSCSASIDFNVPGKPSPPPVSLTATLWHTSSASTSAEEKTEFEFTDSSGTLAPAGFPLNHWVEINPQMGVGIMI